ncbi:tyrosine-type recombinase/integrase [Enterococcus haemoperoxidus]|nr:tyrosine-type recombinase/integrase [Enterococcus haemoperoxidus]
MFTDINGKMIYRTDIYQRSKRLAEKANLPNIGCHGFRHTHATLLFEAKVTAKEIQERLGHSEISMTLDIYTHITKEVEKETVKKLTNHISF